MMTLRLSGLRPYSLALVLLVGTASACDPAAAGDEPRASSDERVASPDGGPLMLAMAPATRRAGCAGGWCAVPAGQFVMGSPKAEPCRKAEEEQHTVTLTNSFLLRQTEITRGEFTSLMPKESLPPVYWEAQWKNHVCHADCQAQKDKSACSQDCPMTGVSWNLAADYCNRLSLAELGDKCQVCLVENGRLSCKPADPSFCQCYECTGTGTSTVCKTAPQFEGGKIYSCPGYRLPTEAEWEYAYRAGTTTALHTGQISTCEDADDASAQAAGWYKRNAYTNIGPNLYLALHPGGEKGPNAWGLHDMAGNLLEWVHSAHAVYPTAEGVVNPNPSESKVSPLTRVLRGGYYESLAPELRAAARSSQYPWAAQDHFGFRCVRSLF